MASVQLFVFWVVLITSCRKEGGFVVRLRGGENGTVLVYVLMALVVASSLRALSADRLAGFLQETVITAL